MNHLAPLLLLLLLASPGSAQSPDSTLGALESAYERLDYEAVEAGAQRVFEHYSRFSPAQLLRVHTLLGIVNYAQNDLTASRAHFMSALSLDPDLALDPRLVSPKIRAFFDEVRDGERMEGAVPPGNITVRYLALRDPRPSAAWRSVILPGWGHLYLGEETRGVLLIGLWMGSLAGAWLAHQVYDPKDAAPAVQWAHVRDGFLLSAVALWLYSYIDVVHLWKPPGADIAVGVLPTQKGAPSVVLHVRL